MRRLEVKRDLHGFSCVAVAEADVMLGDRAAQYPNESLVGGVLLSFGPSTPLYKLLYWIFPPTRAIRDPSRFGYLFLFAIAGLAGIGFAQLRRRWHEARWLGPVAVGLILVTQLEALHAPFDYSRFEGFSPIYETIAADPDQGAVVELPADPVRPFRNGDYVLAATVHWKPLVNGYSSFIPRSYRRMARRLQKFPNRRSIRALQRRDVTFVVFHASRYERQTANRILRRIERRRPELQLITVDDNGSYLYRLGRRQADR